ncbi:hypothetical protein [Burkholderia alba]|uniref:hypothetical protein n=1 Tax=Burkholderia alba TaxID=2683677 RepID=UPI002B059562|nr:hypothetical protein [Burkholderia alba]
MTEWTKRFLCLALNAAMWLTAMGVLLFIIGSHDKSSFFPVLLFTVGGVGAVLANYRRLSEIPEQMADINLTLRRTAIVQIFVSPFIGGTFALLLWMLFFSGILQGSLFPVIEGADQLYSNFHDLMANTHPYSYVDAAKGVVWAFVAGYAERFVPNVIDRIASDAEAKTKEAPIRNADQQDG